MNQSRKLFYIFRNLGGNSLPENKNTTTVCFKRLCSGFPFSGGLLPLNTLLVFFQNKKCKFFVLLELSRLFSPIYLGESGLLSFNKQGASVGVLNTSLSIHRGVF